MATTFNDYTGDGNATKNFSFPLYKSTDIKVEVDNVLKSLTTHYTTSYTDGASSGTITFTSGNIPTAPAKIHIFRDTDVDTAKVTFAAGASIKAADLNNFYKQLLYAAQEEQNQDINTNDVKDDAITSTKIAAGTIVNADINASAAVALSKLATGALPSAITVASANIVDGSIGPGDLATNSVTTAKILDNNVTDAKINTVAATKLTGTIADARFPSTLPALDGSNLTGLVELVDEDNFASDSATKAPSQQSVKAYIGTTSYTKAESDANYYNIGTTEEIVSGETWVGDDAKVATTKAIDNRIVDIVDDVGGFVALANEAAIPTAHPEAANATTSDRVGTILSIGVLSATYAPSGGTCTIPSGTLTNHSVNATITDCGSTTLSAGFGVLVETTAQTDAQYAAGPAFKFHRLTPKATEVTTVAGKATEITTCHTNITNINTVAGNNTNINTVAGANSNITTVAGANSNISTVATNISDVNNFADLYQIGNSAPGTDGGGNALAAGDLWFDSSSNKTLKVHTGTAFAAVSPAQSVLDDISIVSGDLTRQEDLGSIADALASPTTTSDLETCADNITSINTFANIYRIAASAPSSSLDEGDLWYDSANNVLKYYTGSAWTVTAGAGLSAVADDTSPELAAHLDCNNKNLTEVATVSGDNLQIDFGSIA